MAYWKLPARACLKVRTWQIFYWGLLCGFEGNLSFSNQTHFSLDDIVFMMIDALLILVIYVSSQTNVLLHF